MTYLSAALDDETEQQRYVKRGRVVIKCRGLHIIMTYLSAAVDEADGSVLWRHGP